MKSKLWIGFAAISALLIIALLSTYQGINSIKKARASIIEKEATAINHWRLTANLAHQQYQMFDLLFSPDKASRSTLEQRIHARARENDQLFAKLIAASEQDTKVSSGIKRLKALRAAYVETREKQILPLVHEEKIQRARRLHAGVQRLRFEGINALSNSLAQQAHEQSLRQALETAQKEKQAVQRIVLTSVGTLFLGIAILMVWIHHTIGSMVRNTIGGISPLPTASEGIGESC